MFNPLFQDAVDIVLEHEGGLSDDPHDPGGMTNWGISQRFCDEHKLNIDLKQLTEAQAELIYYKYFWTAFGFWRILNSSIVNKLFDTAVNVGPHEAIKIAQYCIAETHPGFAIDGILGLNTATALNDLGPSDTNTFLAHYKEDLAQYYKELVIEKPELHPFLQGWLKRSNS